MQDGFSKSHTLSYIKKGFTVSQHWTCRARPNAAGLPQRANEMYLVLE